MTADESKLRDIIADVRALRESVTAQESSTIAFGAMAKSIDEKLLAIERKLGGLLPPIGGKFNIALDTVIKPR